MKISQTQPKRETPKRIIITSVVEGKATLTLDHEKGELRECLQLLAFGDEFDDNNGRREMRQFLVLSMAETTATLRKGAVRRRQSLTSLLAIWPRPQQHYEIHDSK